MWALVWEENDALAPYWNEKGGDTRGLSNALYRKPRDELSRAKGGDGRLCSQAMLFGTAVVLLFAASLETQLTAAKIGESGLPFWDSGFWFEDWRYDNEISLGVGSEV